MTDINQKHKTSRTLFLKNAAILLAYNYWSQELVNKAEEKSEMEQNYSAILFPSGMAEILSAFEDWQNQKMLELLDQSPAPSKIREKIAFALEIRILDIISKEALLNHISYCFLPPYIMPKLQGSLDACDLIWQYAGDKSTDLNYYTKRGLLLSVYAAAQTFYLSDDSENFVKTREFIRSGLDNIINIAKILKK